MKGDKNKIIFVLILIGVMIMMNGKKEAIMSTGCQSVSNFDTCGEIRAAFGGISTLYALQRTTTSCTGTSRIVCVSDVNNQECINSNSDYTNYLTCPGSGGGCTDSDGSATNYQTKGCVTVSGNTLCDECISNTELSEGTCVSGYADWNIKDCIDYGSNWICSDGKCVQNPTSNFQVLSKTASKEGFSIKATYIIKNTGSNYENFIVEAQTDYQSKKTAQIGLQSVCNINCPYNVYRSVGLSAGEMATIDLYIPRQGGSMPNGKYFVKAVSADRCGTGNTALGPFPDQPIIQENIEITSGIPSPADLCTTIYCGDNQCNGGETYQTCSVDCSADCNTACTGWTDASCGTSDANVQCKLNEMRQTQTCTIYGCSLSQCVFNNECGKICSPANENNFKNCTTSNCEGKQKCQNSQWGICTKNDPNCGICDESTCGAWSDCVSNKQTRLCTDTDCVATYISKSCGDGGGGGGGGSPTDFSQYTGIFIALLAIMMISKMGSGK